MSGALLVVLKPFAIKVSKCISVIRKRYYYLKYIYLIMPTGDKNSLPYRRQQSSESNRNRWKDGCPESTRQKMSESAFKRHEREKNGTNEDSRTIL